MKNYLIKFAQVLAIAVGVVAIFVVLNWRDVRYLAGVNPEIEVTYTESGRVMITHDLKVSTLPPNDAAILLRNMKAADADGPARYVIGFREFTLTPEQAEYVERMLPDAISGALNVRERLPPGERRAMEDRERALRPAEQAVADSSP